MNFLLGGKVGKDRNEEWLEHFDVVICGLSNPGPPWAAHACDIESDEGIS